MTTSTELARREMRDRHAAGVLESSVLIRPLARALVSMERAARASSAAALVRRGLAAWDRLPRADRQFMSGVLCVTAALAHLALALAGQAPPAWLWIVPPAIVLAIGATLIVASAAAEPRDTR